MKKQADFSEEERVHHGETMGEAKVPVVAQVEVKVLVPSRRYRKASPLENDIP